MPLLAPADVLTTTPTTPLPPPILTSMKTPTRDVDTCSDGNRAADDDRAAHGDGTPERAERKLDGAADRDAT